MAKSLGLMLHSPRRLGRSSSVLALRLFVGVLVGCASNQPVREVQSSEQLVAARQSFDIRAANEMRAATSQLLHRLKSEYDDFATGRTQTEPVFNMLIISGGADWGAFGAGFLKGWRRVLANARRRSRCRRELVLHR